MTLTLLLVSCPTLDHLPIFMLTGHTGSSCLGKPCWQTFHTVQQVSSWNRSAPWRNQGRSRMRVKAELLPRSHGTNWKSQRGAEALEMGHLHGGRDWAPVLRASTTSVGTQVVSGCSQANRQQSQISYLLPGPEASVDSMGLF